MRLKFPANRPSTAADLIAKTNKHASPVDAIASDLDRVLEVFLTIRLRLRQLAGALSGGEQQKVATARALMARPKLLCMKLRRWHALTLAFQGDFSAVNASCFSRASYRSVWIASNAQPFGHLRKKFRGDTGALCSRLTVCGANPALFCADHGNPPCKRNARTCALGL